MQLYICRSQGYFLASLCQNMFCFSISPGEHRRLEQEYAYMLGVFLRPKVPLFVLITLPTSTLTPTPPHPHFSHHPSLFLFVVSLLSFASLKGNMGFFILFLLCDGCYLTLPCIMSERNGVIGHSSKVFHSKSFIFYALSVNSDKSLKDRMYR